MKLKKRAVIIASIFSTTILTSAVMGGIFYGINTKNANKVSSTVLVEHDKYPFLPGNRDLENSHDASFDFNLKEIKEPILVPEPEPIPDPIQPEPDLEPEPKEEPELIPPTPEPEKEPEPQPQPELEPEKPKEPEPHPIIEEKQEEPKNEKPQITPEEPKKEELEEKPIPPNEHPKPEPTPAPIQPEPQPPKPAPKKEEMKPSPKSNEVPKKREDNNAEVLGDDEAYVEIAGVVAKAKVKKPVPRKVFKVDIEKGLTNLDPYTNILVSEIKSIEVTNEVREANTRLGKRYLKSLVWNDAFVDLWEHDPKTNPKFSIERYLDLKKENNYYKKVFERYSQLLDSPNLVNFLTEEGKQKLPELNKIEHQWKRYTMLLKYIDYSKITKTTPEVEKYLKEGYEIGDEIFIDSEGRIGAYSFSPPPKNNSVTSRMMNENLKRRAFSYNSWYPRDNDSIINDTYPGWTKSDITADFKQYGASKDDGIIVEKLVRDQKTETQINEGIVITIDAANKKGYKKAIDFINKVKESKKEIQGYRIRNMGLNDINQPFYDLIKALPNELGQLQLFFEFGNTSSLIALEGKEIKELSMYAPKNLNANWNINPHALKKVKWINTVDYNVSDYRGPDKVYTRAVFDALSFDAVDYNESAPTYKQKVERINDGLRMAYFVRNNEPFFQGGFGPGLNPDHDEKNNSYFLGLDLSRVPNVKSLKDLVFNDELKPENGMRKLKRLVLFNDSSTFTIDASELNEAQFKDVIVQEPIAMPPSKISFSNGSNTTKIRITTINGELNANGIQNLRVLKKYSSLGNQAEVDMNNQNLVNAVKSAGFNPTKISVNEYEYN